MSLKQFLSNIQSGTERFYTLSASLVHRLSKLAADRSALCIPRIHHEIRVSHVFEGLLYKMPPPLHQNQPASTTIRTPKVTSYSEVPKVTLH